MEQGGTGMARRNRRRRRQHPAGRSLPWMVVVLLVLVALAIGLARVLPSVL